MRTLILAPLLGLLPLLAQAFELPAFEQVRAAHVSSDALLLDRNGLPLADLRLDPHVRQFDWVPLTALSPAMREALLAAEDKRFFTHSGIDWLAFAGAAWQNLWGPGKRGASTLTMQLAGLLDPELRMPPGRGERRSLAQKWDQSRAAVELEQHWSKTQILEAYLNLAPFRGDIKGIGAASELLFGLRPNTLSPREASLLAALLRGPNANPQLVARRACQLLDTLRRKLPCSEVSQLAQRRLDAPRNRPRYDAAPHLARALLKHPGQRLSTTLDGSLQRRLLAVLGKGAEPAASVLVLDNANAEVLAWIGARAADAADGVLQPRQLPDWNWPFITAAALDQRLLNAASPLRLGLLILDANDARAAPDSWMSLRRALVARQPAAMAEVHKLLDRESWAQLQRSLGLAPAAGTAAAPSLLQLAGAWRSLAGGGQWLAPRWLPAHGNEAAPSRVWRSETGFILQDILAGPESIWNARWSSRCAPGTIVITGSNARHTFAIALPEHEAAELWPQLLAALGGESKAPAPPETLLSALVRFDPADEPPRREWFLPGTVIEFLSSLPDGRRGRIVSPAAGETLTLPQGTLGREHLILRAAGSVAMRWWIDGELAGQGDHLAWLAKPGQHLLTLADPDDRQLHSLSFFVSEATPPEPANEEDAQSGTPAPQP